MSSPDPLVVPCREPVVHAPEFFDDPYSGRANPVALVYGTTDAAPLPTGTGKGRVHEGRCSLTGTRLRRRGWPFCFQP